MLSLLLAPVDAAKPAQYATGAACLTRRAAAGDDRGRGHTGGLDVTNVVWCTGFHPAFDWVELPVFDHDGNVRHESGVVAGQPGLYFVGLHFLHALSSGMVHGVGRDARRVVGQIASGRTHRDVGRAGV
jgi:putative flavoprotein involved in K+ transport